MGVRRSARLSQDAAPDSGKHGKPLDLVQHPELAALVRVVDFEELLTA